MAAVPHQGLLHVLQALIDELDAAHKSSRAAAEASEAQAASLNADLSEATVRPRPRFDDGNRCSLQCLTAL